MIVKNKHWAIFCGIVLFAGGALLGTLLYGLTLWGDLEAAHFDSSMNAEHRLNLHCPVAISVAETGTVALAVSNPLDRPTERTVRTHIAEKYLSLVREETRRVTIAPGETQRLTWTVTAEDAVWGSWILARVFLFGYTPFPARAGTCGILVTPLAGFPGGLQLALAWLVAWLGMALGGGLWFKARRPLSGSACNVARMLAMTAALVLVGMIVSLLGAWLIGVLVFAVTILMMVVAIASLVTNV